MELRNIYGPIEQEEEDEDEPTKATPTSKHKGSDKRDRSEAETSDVEDLDSDADEEDIEVAKQSVPQKKVKAAVGSRKSKRTTIESGFYNETAASLKQAALQAKEATKNSKKARPQKSNIKGATSNQAEQSDIKTESEDLLMKSEPDTSTGFQDKASIISSSDQGSKAKNKPTKAVTAMKPHPEKLSTMPPMSLDMIATIQQQMAADPQNIMNLMYQNLGKAPQEGGNFAELLAGANFMQNKSPDLYQQQQQYFQAQLALQQMQQQKQQQQLLQLQQQLRFMQAKSGMEYDKEKEFANRMAQGESNLTLPGHLSSMSKAMAHQNFASMLPRNYQFPGSMAGFGNLPFNPSLSDNYLANGYNGLSMGSPLEGKPIPPYMNIMQDSNPSKAPKAFRNE